MRSLNTGSGTCSSGTTAPSIGAKTVKGKAHAIVLDTWKGMGMNFAEKVGYNHFLTVTDEIADSAIKEIENRFANGTYPKGDLVW